MMAAKAPVDELAVEIERRFGLEFAILVCDCIEAGHAAVCGVGTCWVTVEVVG